MATVTLFQATWGPRALAALRIVSGYLFLAHGTTKLFQSPCIEMFANVPLDNLRERSGSRRGVAIEVRSVRNVAGA